MVLLGQCFYYRGFTWRDPEPTTPPKVSQSNVEADERTNLLGERHHERRRSADWTGLSPAVPHISETETPPPSPSTLQTFIWNAAIVVMVCAAGVLGWFLGESATGGDKKSSTGGEDAIEFNVLGQFFGYLCAVFYIASRVPQLILNYRRKTTEGLSMLFFLFACLGNVTYVLSIFAYDPECKEEKCQPGESGRIYGRYMLVNLSWLAGSLVTLFMDMVVFCQYFYYAKDDGNKILSNGDERNGTRSNSHDEDATYDQRPLLQREDSGH